MSQKRTWAEPVDRVHAERLFSRFVRNSLRKRRVSEGVSGTEATTLVAAPTRPKRRVNEATTAMHRSADDLDVDEVRRRRLLGQDALDGSLNDEDRHKLVLEMKALYKHGHVEDVVAEIDRVRSKYPTDVELYGQLGDFFLDRGDLVRAVDMLFCMVDANFERADAVAARRCLERIKALDPENRRLQRFEKLMRSGHP